MNVRLIAGMLMAGALSAQTVERPKVLGVAHFAMYVKDLAKARQFYEGFLGYGEPFTLPNRDHTGVRIAFAKVNDFQYFEIFNEKDRGEGQLNHISFYTDDAGRMYAYLKSKGVAVLSDKGSVGKGQTGNRASDTGSAHVCFLTDDIQELHQKLRTSHVRLHCEPQDLDFAKVLYFRDPDGIILEAAEGHLPG